MIIKVKNTVLWTFVISDLNSEEVVGRFPKKSCKRQIEKSLLLKKVIKKKGDKIICEVERI